MARILSLQVGRGIAALAVVMCHSAISTGTHAPVAMAWLWNKLYLGVDYFFVLSGFIIYHSTVGKGRSFSSFASARFRRVFLPYWPIGLGVALLYMAGIGGDQWSWSWLPTLTLAPVSPGPALSVAWTLQHELVFYAAFALFYFSGLLVPGMIAWAILIFTAALIGNPPIALQTINLEFLFGITVAVLYRKDWNHPGLIPLGLVLATIWARFGASHETSATMGMAFACVMLAVVSWERKGRFTVPAALVFLGTASYSIYLVHNPVMSIASRFSGSMALLVVVGTIAGIAYFLGFERWVCGMAPRASARLATPSVTPATPTAG